MGKVGVSLFISLVKCYMLESYAHNTGAINHMILLVVYTCMYNKCSGVWPCSHAGSHSPFLNFTHVHKLHTGISKGEEARAWYEIISMDPWPFWLWFGVNIVICPHLICYLVLGCAHTKPWPEGQQMGMISLSLPNVPPFIYILYKYI